MILTAKQLLSKMLCLQCLTQYLWNSKIDFMIKLLPLWLAFKRLLLLRHFFLDIAKMSEFTQLYGGDCEDITHEIYKLKRLIERSKAANDVVPNTLLDLAKFLEPYKLAFAELYNLLFIALTLPVSSATSERSFSALKLIKTHLRSTMCDVRLSNIAILSIESSRAESLSLDAL